MNTSSEQLFLNSRQLADRLGVSSMTVGRMRRCGRLPLPCYSGTDTTLWTVEDIDAWEASGRPIDVERAIDAGMDACHRADMSSHQDAELSAIVARHPDSGELRALVDGMRQLADVCERILNESANFEKPPVTLPASRCRLQSHDGDDPTFDDTLEKE